MGRYQRRRNANSSNPCLFVVAEGIGLLVVAMKILQRRKPMPA